MGGRTGPERHDARARNARCAPRAQLRARDAPSRGPPRHPQGEARATQTLQPVANGEQRHKRGAASDAGGSKGVHLESARR